jgi:hypothetical protein
MSDTLEDVVDIPLRARVCARSDRRVAIGYATKHKETRGGNGEIYDDAVTVVSWTIEAALGVSRGTSTSVLALPCRIMSVGATGGSFCCPGATY